MAETKLVDLLAVGTRVKLARFAWITDEEMRAIACPSEESIWATISKPYEGGMYVNIRVDMDGRKGLEGLVDLYHIVQIQPPEMKQVVITTTVGIVNDHVCTTCGNDRCAKTEKSCWSCGAPISV